MGSINRKEPDIEIERDSPSNSFDRESSKQDFEQQKTNSLSRASSSIFYQNTVSQKLHVLFNEVLDE